MKSAKKKAAEVCRKLGLPVLDDENGVAYQIILQALQEHGQDRERATRYACAEMVFEKASKKEDCMIDASAAHAACMNAKVA